MVDRPLSVLTKAQRNSMDLIDTDALLAHYEDVFASRFRWTGGPEGMPEDWPERMIWRHGLLGEADAFGGPQLAGGNVGLRGIYGQPLNWFPVVDGTTIPDGWMQAHEGPTLWLHFIPRMEAEPLCMLMGQAWRCMRSNILAMSQPVIVQGTIGAELNVKEADEAINGIIPTVLTLERGGVDAKALESALSYRYPQVAWFQVYVTNMTLTVQVAHGVPMPEMAEAETGDLTADRNGIIHSIRVFAGTPAVKPGDVVQKGDVLIS